MTTLNVIDRHPAGNTRLGTLVHAIKFDPVMCSVQAPIFRQRISASANLTFNNSASYTSRAYLTMADDSDSSSLSSAPEEEVQKLAPIFIKAKKATKAAAPPPKASPQRPRRPPSPPHEDVLADKQDIAVSRLLLLHENARD